MRAAYTGRVLCRAAGAEVFAAEPVLLAESPHGDDLLLRRADAFRLSHEFLQVSLRERRKNDSSNEGHASLTRGVPVLMHGDVAVERLGFGAERRAAHAQFREYLAADLSPEQAAFMASSRVFNLEENSK